ncbi:MAG: hypothetical protein AB7F98_00950 [Novosphingobium sp.]
MSSLSGSDRSITVALAAALALFAVIAIAEPLAAYAVALALFGLPHVLSELRYADRRFGRRVGLSLVRTVLGMLCAIVAMRAATGFGLIDPAIGAPAELGGVALLALLCVRGGLMQKCIALAVGLSIGSGVLLAPFDTMIVLSVLHNLTPLGFFWEIAPQSRRGWIMGLASAGLLGLPLLVATGLPGAALATTGWAGRAADPLAAGSLYDQLHVYVPSWLAQSPQALDLFAGAVVAQGGHYLAVIIVLPLLLRRYDPQARGLLAWPRDCRFAVLVAALGVASLAGFLAMGFAEARLLYGLAAAFHAWIEVPLLILALTGGVQPWISSPASNEAALASSEASMA